jgi:hypothetical protein
MATVTKAADNAINLKQRKRIEDAVEALERGELLRLLGEVDARLLTAEELAEALYRRESKRPVQRFFTAIFGR